MESSVEGAPSREPLPPSEITRKLETALNVYDAAMDALVEILATAIAYDQTGTPGDPELQELREILHVSIPDAAMQGAEDFTQD